MQGRAFCYSDGRKLFGFRRVRGLHHDLDEVALGEDFLEGGLDLLLGEGVDRSLVLDIDIVPVGQVGLDGGLPIGVGQAALGNVLLEVQDGAAHLIVGRAVGRQVVDAVKGQAAEFVAQGRAAGEGDLDIHTLLGTAGEADVRAGAVGAAFILAKGVRIADVQDVGDGVQGGLAFGRVRDVGAVHLDDGAHRGLHVDGEDVFDAALRHADAVIGPLEGLLALRDGSDVLLYQRLEGVHVDIAHDQESKAGGIVEQGPVVLLQRLEACRIENLLGEQLLARVVPVHGLGKFLLELVIRLALEVREDGLDLVDAVLVFIRVEAGFGEEEIYQLQGGLQVLLGGLALDAVVEGINVRCDAQALPGKHLGYLGSGEAGNAGVVEIEAVDVGIEGGDVRIGDEALAAVLEQVEQNLVLGIVGLEENDLRTVLEHPFLGTVQGVLGLLGLGTLEEGRIQELGGDLFAFQRLDVRGFDLGDSSKDLLFGRRSESFLLRTGVDDNKIVVGDHLGGKHGQDLGVDGVENLLDDLQFGLGFHIRVVVEEVAQQRTDELGILAGRSRFDGVLHNGQDLVLRALEFLVPEAEALHPLDFREEALEAVHEGIFLHRHVGDYRIDVFIDELRDGQAAGEIRAVRLRCDVGEALLHDQGDKDLEDILHLTDNRGVVRFRHRFALPDHLDGRGRGLRVGDDADDGLRVVRKGQVLLGLRVLALGDYGENLLDLGLGAVHIHVTHDHDGLHIRMVPGRVEVAEAFRLEGLQTFLLADQGAALHLRSLEIVGEGTLHRAPGGVAALAALLDDDTTLLVDFLGLVEDEMGVVAQDHQAGVHDGFALDGDIVQHVLGFLETGGGVDVPAEFRADGAEIVQDALVGEVRRSIEAHVLKEVREAVLVWGFLDGADVGGKIEFRPPRRKLVVADVIGKSVFQVSYADRRIVGEGGHRLLRGLGLILLGAGRDEDQHQREEEDDNQKSFHVLCICVFVYMFCLFVTTTKTKPSGF